MRTWEGVQGDDYCAVCQMLGRLQKLTAQNPLPFPTNSCVVNSEPEFIATALRPVVLSMKESLFKFLLINLYRKQPNIVETLVSRT